MDKSSNIDEIKEGCPSESSEAGRASMCEGCPGQQLCQAQGGLDPAQKMIDLRMNAIKHKIIILSGKGGVGKSTVAAHLAMALASHMEREASNKKSFGVGVVDVDVCGPSIPQLLGVRGQDVINTQYGWKPLVSPHFGIKVMSVGALLESQNSAVLFRGPRKTGLIKRFLKDTFWGRMDFLICDTPPGTSDEHLTVVKLLKQATKPSGAVLVTSPQDVATDTVRREIQFCHKMGLPLLGVVENMAGFACPCCGEMSDIFPAGSVEKLCEDYNLRYLGKIPILQDISASCEAGDTMENLSEADQAFQRLATVLTQILD